MKLEQGTRIDRYTVEELLGTGGMAAVYRVRHAELNTVHALKVILTEAEDPLLRERLLQEGRAQGLVRHPGVLSVTDMVDVQGSPGLILEFVEGGLSLAELLRDGPVPLDEARRLGRAILEGVAAAHRHGLVHRDLKPSNVLLVNVDGVLVPKIADFGLAKVLAGGGLTATGLSLGTPCYMAPEQARDSRSVDHRADLWSVGAILYELVRGERAFQGHSLPEIIASVIAGRYPPLPDDLPRDLRDTVEAALVVDPAARAASADVLLTLWRGGASRSDAEARAATLAFDDAARVRDSVADTLALDAPPDHPEPTPASPRSDLQWAAIGAVVGLPVGLGSLSLAFGSVRDIAPAGFFGWGTLLLFALSTGAAGWFAGRQRHGAATATLSWLVVPAGVAALGLAGAILGMQQAAGAVDTMSPETRALATIQGTEIALRPALAGWLLGTLAALSVALLAALVQPEGATRVRDRSPLLAAGLGLAAGAAVWIAEAALGLDRPASFLLFVVVAAGGFAIGGLERWDHPARARARTTAWVASVIAVHTAGLAVHIHEARNLALSAAADDGADLVATGALLAVELGLPPAWMPAWLIACALPVAVSAWGRPRPRTIDVVGPALVGGLFGLGMIAAGAVQGDLAERIPRALETVALEGPLGIRIEPAAEGADRSVSGIGAVVDPGPSSLLEGDRLFAWDGAPLESATAFAAGLARLQPGDEVALTVLRGEPPRLVQAELVRR